MTKRTLIICADSTEAHRMFLELTHSTPGNKGYKSRREVVQIINDKSESTLFKTLRQLDSLDGYRFDKVTITNNAYKNGSLSAMNHAIELKRMLTLHVPREESE